MIRRYFYSSDDEGGDEDKNRGRIKSKPTEALTLSEFWSSTRSKESRKLASNSNGHDNEEHHQHTEHNYCIMLEFKGQIFPFVIGTDNFEEFKRNIKHTVKETTLSPDNTTLSYDTEFNGKVIQVVINSKITYSAFLQMLKTTGKTVLLKIADSNPSLISNCSKGVMEDCKVSEPKDTITNVPIADATGKDVVRWLESVQWKTSYLMKIKSLSDAVRLRERTIKELIGPLEEVSCQTCKPHHKIKTFKYNEESVIEKVKLLLTTQELNTFSKKRKTAMLIYGNRLVLLNPLFS